MGKTERKNKRYIAESHKADPPEIRDRFAELKYFLETLPLEDNNVVLNLRCRICVAYERKTFMDSFYYGTQLMKDLQ